MCDLPAFMTLEQIAERWPLDGNAYGRWYEQVRRWKAAPKSLLKLWRDYKFDTSRIGAGRYPYTYRTKRIVYLLLTEETGITSEVRDKYLDSLRAAYHALLQTPLPSSLIPETPDNPISP